MAPEPALGRRRLAALALSAALAPLNSTMLSVVIPAMSLSLGQTERWLTQLLVPTYLATSIVMQAPSGKLGDRWGHQHALAYGQAAFAFGSIVAAAAPNEWVLAGSRVLMALAGALIVPSAAALIRVELPPEKRGQAFGLFGAAMGLAAATGPLIAGFVASLATWRGTFAVNLVILPVAVWLGRGAPPAVHRSEASSRFDWLGSLLLGVALGLVIYGSSPGHEQRALLLGLAALLGALFVLWERRHVAPVVNLALFRSPVLVAGGMITALHNFGIYALLFELPRALHRLTTWHGRGVGGLLSAMMLPMVVASPLSGRLTDRLGPRRVAVVGATLAVLGMVYLRLAPVTLAMIPGLVLIGLGLGFSGSPSQAAAMSAAPREDSGMAAATLAILRYLGGVAGVLALGAVTSGSDDFASAYADHRAALTLFSIALVPALAFAWLLPREAPRGA